MTTRKPESLESLVREAFRNPPRKEANPLKGKPDDSATTTAVRDVLRELASGPKRAKPVGPSMAQLQANRARAVGNTNIAAGRVLTIEETTNIASLKDTLKHVRDSIAAARHRMTPMAKLTTAKLANRLATRIRELGG